LTLSPRTLDATTSFDKTNGIVSNEVHIPYYLGSAWWFLALALQRVQMQRLSSVYIYCLGMKDVDTNVQEEDCSFPSLTSFTHEEGEQCWVVRLCVRKEF